MLERKQPLLGVKVVDLLMLETPSAVGLSNMWFKREEWHRTKRHSVCGLNVTPVLARRRDAMPEIAKEVQVLEAEAFDFGIAKGKQLRDPRRTKAGQL